jgi:cytochrome c biogenesis protein CcmG/thiol:disulfide interchange protein DsbE
MSNRPNRSRRPEPRRSVPPDRSRALWIVAGVVALVVALGVVIALAGGGEESTDDGRPDVGPVAIEGQALPEPGDGSDPAAGTLAPRIEGTDPEGDAITVGGSGEPTLVAFLAHWCPHCQAEVPVLVDLMEDGSLDGVRTVGVLTATDRSRPNHPPVAWLEREGWAGEILLDDEQGTAARSYGLDGFPFIVFLDADGNVVARTSGEVGADALRELIAEID